MPYSRDGYLERAEECVRFANSTKDKMLSADLLKLRQTYLRLAEHASLRDDNGAQPTPKT